MNSVLPAHTTVVRRPVALALTALLALILTAFVAAPAHADGPAIVNGTVTAAVGGAPVAGIEVYAFAYNLGYDEGDFEDESPDAFDTAPNAVTDASGHYSISVPGDSYDIVFVDPANNLLINYLFGDLIAGDTFDNWDVALSPASSISGTLTAPGGAPVGSVRVEAYGSHYGLDEAEGTALTDASGHFSLRGLSSGTYRLYVADNFKPRWIGGTSFDTATAYGLHSATDRTGVDILDFKRGSKVTFGATSPSVGKATLTISVRQSFFSAAAGKVSVKDGTKTLKSAVTLIGGKATVKLTGLKKGYHTFKVTFAATTTVLGSSATHVLKVK